MTVVPLGLANSSETLIEFIRREGAVSTTAIGWRFGWDTRRAYRELEALRRAGKITKDLEILDYCAMNGWRSLPTENT